MRFSLAGSTALAVLALLSATATAAKFRTPRPLPSAIGLTPHELPALAGGPHKVETGKAAKRLCGEKCDEVWAYQHGTSSESARTVDKAVLHLELGRIQSVTWTYRGKTAKPNSYPALAEVFPDRRIPPGIREVDASVKVSKHGITDYYVRDLSWQADGASWTAMVLSPITKKLFSRARKATIEDYRVVMVNQGGALPPAIPQHFSDSTLKSRGELQEQSSKFVAIDEDGITPRVIYKPAPYYPRRARNDKLEGVVVVMIYVDITGVVTKTEILESDPDFDKSAVQAVSRWRYEPVVINGIPVTWKSRVTLRFQLR